MYKRSAESHQLHGPLSLACYWKLVSAFKGGTGITADSAGKKRGGAPRLLQATRDFNDLPGNVVRERRRQEEDHSGCLFRGSRAANWDGQNGGLARPGGNAELDFIMLQLDAFTVRFRRRQASVNQTEGCGVHLDVHRSPLARQRLGEADDARLSRGIVGLAKIAARAGGGTDIHDLSCASGSTLFDLLFGGFTHRCSQHAEDPEGRREMDIDHRLPLLIGHLVNRSIPGDPCVVYQDLRNAEDFERGFEKVFRKTRCGHVPRKRLRSAAGAANALHGPPKLVFVHVIQHDAGTFARKQIRRGASDAAGGPSHHCNSAFQPPGHACPSSFSSGSSGLFTVEKKLKRVGRWHESRAGAGPEPPAWNCAPSFHNGPCRSTYRQANGCNRGSGTGSEGSLRGRPRRGTPTTSRRPIAPSIRSGG